MCRSTALQYGLYGKRKRSSQCMSRKERLPTESQLAAHQYNASARLSISVMSDATVGEREETAG
eukprot:scaffold375_cov378-Prasinococcus_capsulatus_cf.AAC.29